RCSSIHTMSPTENSFFSSCAWYFLVRRTVFLRSGWVKRRSTRTITVLSCLSLTTVPCSMRFGIPLSSLPRMFPSPLLPGDGLNPGDVAPPLVHPRGVLELAGRPLESQVEPLLLELDELLVELVQRHQSHIRGLHREVPNRRCVRRSAS